MKHHKYLGILITVLIFMSPVFAFGQIFTKPTSNLTISFGGKVLTTKIPTVTCPGATGLGTAPVVLSSNLAGVGQATVGASSGNQSVGQRIGNVVGGLYKAIPLYTIRISSATGLPLKQPKPGDWILGRHYLLPNISTCNTTLLGGVPFPVIKTDNYGVSQ